MFPPARAANPAALLISILLAGCSVDAADPATAAPQASVLTEVTLGDGDHPFRAFEVATFNEPWAATFLPGGRLLVTEKRGRLFAISADGSAREEIAGVPDVDYGGQGGFGDVVLHPDFANNRRIYLSYAEAGDGSTRGAAVARATLTLDENGGRLSDLEVIWRQVPKVSGRGHFGHRLAFGSDGYLFIASGERQKFTPAQDMQSNLGKIVRLFDDGRVPADNPFAARGGVAAEVWSLGHRNPLGIAFDADGQLWNTEMGPRHGDELNRVIRGDNYGYPEVSNGDHYDGRKIPDHDTRPEFRAPAVSWVPTIAPSSLMIYSDDLFEEWRGDAFIGGLRSEALIRVEFNGDSATEAARYDMGRRIREVEQGPDGAIWVLEDGPRGRLLKLVPE